MSKELPYFKFFPAEWLSGDIIWLSDDAQALFINICCLYWQRNCKLTKKQVEQRFCKCTANAELLQNNCIKYDTETDAINISFLDEQFTNFNKISRSRSKNAKKRYENKPIESTTPCNSSANAENLHMLKSTIQDKEIDKDKEKDKNKRAIFISSRFEEFWNLYPRREGKKEALRHYNASVQSPDDEAKVEKSINNYLEKLKREKTESRFIQKGSTFFNNWQDYENYTPPPKTESEILKEMGIIA